MSRALTRQAPLQELIVKLAYLSQKDGLGNSAQLMGWDGMGRVLKMSLVLQMGTTCNLLGGGPDPHMLWSDQV